jgi:tetratricopeptide (TPR) repeat protein
VFTFGHPTYLYWLAILPICILLYVYLSTWRKKQLAKIGQNHLIQQLIVNSTSKRLLLQFTAFLLSIGLLIVCLADPKTTDGKQQIKTNSREIILALDLSTSMLATDVSPSRLLKAKQLITQFISNNVQDKIGLVLFAGNAYIAVPITIDVASIKMSVETAQPSMLPTQGTNISEALIRAHDCFDTKRDAGRAIVIISDGEDHEQGIDNAIAICKKDNIQITTIGVGTEDGSNIIDPTTQQSKQDANGQVIISKLNSDELNSIAQKGKGQYLELQNASNTLLALNDALANLESKSSAEEATAHIHYYQWLLLPAICLLLFSIINKPMRTKSIGLQKLALVLFCLQATTAQAQSANKTILQGNSLYKQQQYEQAYKAYKKTADNSANTITQKAIANYNLGNALAKQNNWQGAVDAYKQSLALQPNNADAKYNLCYAQSKLKKQQQQNNKQNSKQQQDKQDQQQKQNPQQQNQQQQNQQSQLRSKPSAKPMPSKLTKQQAEQYLQALKEEEKKIMQKKKGRQTGQQNAKDW